MKVNELTHMMQKPEPKPDTYEAGMALNQLLKIGTHAIKIHNMIDDGAEMEAWVAKKIDLASNYVKSVHGYTAGQKAGTYDDDGMSEMKKMPKGTGTMQGVKESREEIGKFDEDPNDLTKAYKKIAMLSTDVDENPEDADDQMTLASEVARPITQILKKIMDYDKGVEMPGGSDMSYVDMYKKVNMLANKGAQTNDPKIASEIFKTMSNVYSMKQVAEESVSEDAGEQGLANELSKYYQDAADGLDPEDHGNDEHEDYLDIARSFKKGLQAGMDSVNMAGWEFSTNDFDMDRDGKGTMYEPMAELLKKYNVSASLNKKGEAFLIKSGKAITDPGHWDTSKSVSEDAGEGHMSKSQLYQTAKMSIELLDMINKGDDLEGWVQTKLNLAADYLQAVYHYEDYQKLNPYREELDSSLMQKHAGIIQKHLDEILERKCRAEDVDTKPGMMRILKKRVNEVEKEMAKENRKETNEEATIKPYISMYKGDDGKQVYDVLDKHSKSAYKTSDERLAQAFFKKNYNKLREAELEEGIKEWGKRLAMAGVIVAGLAGFNSINDAIDNSVPAVKAMNTALEMAQDAGNDELAKMIEKDLSAVKVRLSSGKDLNFVKGMQDKYAKFMKTEGVAYESQLQIKLSQRI